MRGGSWGYGTLRGPGGRLPRGGKSVHRTITARHAGTCSRCGGAIKPGQRIIDIKGWRHDLIADCQKEAR